ncbi:MAG: hypothetical protein ACE5D6_07880 [Candidatus Zixiibacteriota bacterium]
MLFFKRNKPAHPPDLKKICQLAKQHRKPAFQSTDKIRSMVDINFNDYRNGQYRTKLYRFLTDNIPVISSCISTWVRLSAAPGGYKIVDTDNKNSAENAQRKLDNLSKRIYLGPSANRGSMVTFLTEIFHALYCDGMFGGFLTVKKDGSGIDKFVPADMANLIRQNEKNKPSLLLDMGEQQIDLDRNDFYYIPLNSDVSQPIGRSILQSVPFVSYIEQQLVDDMRRTSHNSGYHRLHVKVTPPERIGGESDSAYTDRINSYFDATVSMIKTCEIDENPVTWDNISVEQIGPQNVRTVTNSWFMNHRAMVEEICAGTNLAPFLLGYSYGSTSTWASFKFDIVMRQVKSVQAEVGSFLEWIGNIELALAGYNNICRFEFDNTFAYQANEKATVQAKFLSFMKPGCLIKKPPMKKREY